MPNVKALIDPFYPDPQQLCVEIAQIVAANVNCDPPFPAIVTTDGTGRPTQVDINLPVDCAQADLSNAIEKVNNNPGVSIARGSGLLVQDFDYDALTPGDPLVSSTSAGGQVTQYFSFASEVDWKAAASAESVGASGSAAEMDPAAGTAIAAVALERRGQVSIDIFGQGLGKLLGYTLTMQLKMGTVGDVGDVSAGGDINFSDNAEANGWAIGTNSNVSPNWFLDISEDASASVDTGVASTSFLDLTIDQNGSVLTLSGGSASISFDSGISLNDNALNYTVKRSDTFSAGGSKSLVSMYIDDLNLLIRT